MVHVNGQGHIILYMDLRYILSMYIHICISQRAAGDCSHRIHCIDVRYISLDLQLTRTNVFILLISGTNSHFLVVATKHNCCLKS